MPFRSCAIREFSVVFPVDLLAAVLLESYAEAWAKRLDEPFAAARYRLCKRTISWTRTRWKIGSTTWHITIWAARQISALHLSNSTARSSTKVYWKKISCTATWQNLIVRCAMPWFWPRNRCVKPRKSPRNWNGRISLNGYVVWTNIRNCAEEAVTTELVYK